MVCVLFFSLHVCFRGGFSFGFFFLSVSTLRSFFFLHPLLGWCEIFFYGLIQSLCTFPIYRSPIVSHVSCLTPPLPLCRTRRPKAPRTRLRPPPRKTQTNPQILAHHSDEPPPSPGVHSARRRPEAPPCARGCVGCETAR